MKIKARTQGFTLVELMVAMAIFALMSAMMYGGFQGIVTAKGSTDRNAARLKSLQMAYLHLGRDFRQIANRPIRNSFGTEEEPLISAQTGTYILELTRGGLPNFEGQFHRSNMQRVAYGLEDETLYKYTWPMLDRPIESKPTKIKILENVERVTLRYLSTTKEWLEYWPPLTNNNSAAQQEIFPRAVEITLQLKDWGKVNRFFELPQV